MKFDAFNILLSKKMTRREFLLYLGMLVFVLSGISGILETLANPHRKISRTKPKTGFGTGAYGS
ncbi:MAG: hypothetical protein ABI758_06160 [Candidatus Woesebacteria bacterium]